LPCFKPRHACAVKPELLKSWSLEIDYSRAPCLGTDQKTRGLWERDWIILISTLIPMEPHPSLDGLCFGLARGLYPRSRIELLKTKPILAERFESCCIA